MIDQFESPIKLNLPKVHFNEDINLFPWKKYNPKKEFRRLGVSLTSLDGQYSGVPDLDSLLEYNKLNGTNYREHDFKRTTPIFDKYFANILEGFVIGRSHLLKLESGGFFPYHRDLDFSCVRVIYTVSNCHPQSLVWIQNDRTLQFEDHSWYLINTKVKHALFSFHTSLLTVFNFEASQENLNRLISSFEIK
jgi:hypothetical protein